MIPKIIHQSWTNFVGEHDYMPPMFKHFSKLMQEYHPTWEYKLWNADEERELIEKDYPWFLPVYDGYGTSHKPQIESGKMKKADAARIFYLHKYGGIYYDIDTECLKPHDDLLQEVEDFGIGQRGDDPDDPAAYPNSVMFARKGSLFLEDMCDHLIKHKDTKLTVDATGPTIVSHVVRKHPVKIFPWQYFYAIDWEPKNNRHSKSAARQDAQLRGIAPDHEETKAKFPNAYSVTYCTTTWMGEKQWLKE